MSKTNDDLSNEIQQQGKDMQELGKDVRHLGVLYEAMQDDLKKLLELLGTELVPIRKIPKIESDLAEVKTDVKTIKRVVTDHSKKLQNHEQRITRLEVAT
jgi:archaellum component FlaC